MEGLTSHELVALVTVGQNLEKPTDWVPSNVIRQDMERAGFTRIAVTLGVAPLLAKGLVSLHEAYDDQSEESYALYSLTEAGLAWLLSNQDKLVLSNPLERSGPDQRDNR